MKGDAQTHKINANLWIFGFFLFFYMFIMGAYIPFFPLWLHEVNGLSKTETGIVFSSIAFFALVFQPIFGVLSDKLGLKKHLLWIITILLVFFAPFFLYVFSPLLKTNIILGALVGGIYLGFVNSGGSPAIEAYVEKVSRRSGFEYGHARLFGCIGWALCASVVGYMFSQNNQFVFWLGSGFALILALLLLFAKPDASASAQVVEELGANSSPVNLRTMMSVFRMKKLWFFVLYIIGVACVYDVFDQQFATFFTTFFASKEQGTEIFGYVTTLGELLNASIMFFAPAIINRIGSKNALLVAGAIMSIRIVGSAFATLPYEVIILKTLHMFEVPFLLVGTFKYITSQFDIRFSASIYLIGFCFFKQLCAIFMSAFAGRMYDLIGFQGAYLILGAIVVGFTLLSAFLLSGNREALIGAPPAPDLESSR
ncbi:MFS transporter [Affinibrenneria salicis]|uniref:MFS transporter n=1 Tax=Affinibrenneria salicis TaxID=2590031 RepID=A0A5J5FZD0_9GAMM|nr:MFS transporter [Affinibrenneria salicis]KAA8999383.1 MFS transporter [Affinibrenneria salicis]